MDLTEQDIRDLIKAEIVRNLSIHFREKSGYYGESWVDVTIKFGEEEVATSHFNLPQQKD